MLKLSWAFEKAGQNPDEHPFRPLYECVQMTACHVGLSMQLALILTFRAPLLPPALPACPPSWPLYAATHWSSACWLSNFKTRYGEQLIMLSLHGVVIHPPGHYANLLTVGRSRLTSS